MFYETRARDKSLLPNDPFKAIVAPRPIGWISTRAPDGRINLAPYSFFNAFSSVPPLVGFSSEGYKDSATFAVESGEFVANLASFDLMRPMSETSAPLPRGQSEFEHAGLTMAPCRLVKAPRVGLYKSWSAALDEGWTRFVFESNGIPYKTLVDADIRKGNLIDQFDAIILPDNPPAAILTGRAGEGRGGSEENRLRLPQVPEEYRGGLGPEGAAALQAFVQAGGTIIANNKAAGVYARKDNPDFSNALNGIASKDFYCPGSILEVNVDTKNPVAFGSTPTVSIFFETGPTFKLSGQAKSILLYPNDHPLLSGWILGGKYLEGTSAAAEVPDGKGKIIAFGFLPMYRGLSEVTYKFLLNAMLYSTSTPASIN